ncbi:MAG: hypothetical protein PUE51_05905 [Veillonellaceae bacterium]|nr:hypothetical protein [Veillonellaceae bacterium]
MADAKTTTATQSAAPAVKYTLGELKEASHDLFGYGPEVIDGAFYGKDGEASYTVKEARDAVEAFLNKPVTAKEGK